MEPMLVGEARLRFRFRAVAVGRRAESLRYIAVVALVVATAAEDDEDDDDRAFVYAGRCGATRCERGAYAGELGEYGGEVGA
jgi:hypothetical protein